MNTPMQPLPYVCPNGHGAPPNPQNGHCHICGAALVPMAPQPAMQSRGGRPAPPPRYAPPPPAGQWPQQAPPPGQWPQQPPPGQYPPQYGYPPYPQQPAYPQGQYPPPGWQPGAPPVIGGGPAPVTICPYCGGEGARLDPSVAVCPQCRWLRPLAPGYVVHPNAFQWGADSQAMAKLRSLAPLNAAARAVSDRVGRRWVETSFNAVRLGENQLPDVFATAVRAARLLGMPYMPDVYVSGDKMWDAVTYGSDRSAFLLIGSALINNFKGDDLLFLLAREMGHCRAGHALWKTVGMFLVGQQPQRKGMMSQGILGALNIEHLLQSALDVPFLMWARQAEITADRAGLLAVGSEEVARRVLLAWSLRSMPLYQQINVDAWLQQQEDSDDQMTRLAEMVNSPTPFITRRLKLLTDYARSPELFNIRAAIAALDQAAYPPAGQAVTLEPPQLQAPPPMVELGTAEPAVESALPADDTAATGDFVRIACTNCGTGMRVPREKLAGKSEFKVRCPNASCGFVLTLRKRMAAPVAGERTDTDE